jgi:tetratricopeptide (TPR) repeat protein
MPLRSLTSRVFLVAICLSAVLWYGYDAIRKYRAFRLSNSTDFTKIQRAVSLEPENAEYRYQMANYLFLTDDDLGAAVQQYQAAIAIDPWVSRYWLDLSRAYLAMDRSWEQEAAVQHALEVDPSTPVTIWTAANLYIAQGNRVQGFDLLGRFIRNDPGSTTQALLLCWRMTHDADTIIGRVLPRSASAYVRFLDFVVNQNDLEAAKVTWRRLLELNEPFPVQTGIHFVSFLIINQQPEEARDAWKQLAFLSPSLRAYLPRTNLMVNSGFEEEMLNGGWDWWYIKVPNVVLSIDSSQFHGGSRSLRIHVDGAVSDVGLRQYVLVRPNTAYEFIAFYRADPLEGGHGLYFAIFDAISNTPLAVTDDIIGVTPWRESSVKFTTGAAARMVVVLVGHTAGLIRGNLWVDDVKLVEP